MKIAPKNWQEFQHYKKRNPPWIRLYRKLLDDRAYQCLPLASKALAPMLWLLASEHPDGTIEATIEDLSWRLRMSESDVKDGLSPLIEKGFFEECKHVASKKLAPRKQVATPETETETETEKTLCAGAHDESFSRFWETWPSSPRKVAKAKCLDVWKRRNLAPLTDSILSHVGVLKTSQQWRGGFEPSPLTYLNQRRWEDGAEEAKRLAI